MSLALVTCGREDQVFEPLAVSSNVHHPRGDKWDAVTPTFSLLLWAVRDL